MPGEGTVIRHVLGAPFRLAARSAQGPVHFPPTWRVMLKRCRPGHSLRHSQGERGRAGGEGGMAPSKRQRERTGWNA